MVGYVRTGIIKEGGNESATYGQSSLKYNLSATPWLEKKRQIGKVG